MDYNKTKPFVMDKFKPKALMVGLVHDAYLLLDHSGSTWGFH